MFANLLAAKGAIVGAWFILFFVGERLVRSAPAPNSPARLYRNIGLWLLTVVFSVGVIAPMTAWGANHAIWQRPSWLMSGGSGAVTLVLDLILLDCWVYWLHRAYHLVPAMWRLHDIHHRDEFLDTTSAVRFHVGEVAVSSILRLMLIAVLAIPLMTVILFEIILLCVSIFQHSNLKLPPVVERAMSRIIVTPSIHWIHHHAHHRDTNSNFASTLSVWDRLFHSRSATKRTPEMKIGIQGVEDRGFFELVLLPFRRTKS